MAIKGHCWLPRLCRSEETQNHTLHHMFSGCLKIGETCLAVLCFPFERTPNGHQTDAANWGQRSSQNLPKPSRTPLHAESLLKERLTIGKSFHQNLASSLKRHCACQCESMSNSHGVGPPHEQLPTKTFFSGSPRETV